MPDETPTVAPVLRAWELSNDCRVLAGRGAVTITLPDHLIEFQGGDECVRLAGLALHGVPDDDSRKLTRETVADLRRTAERASGTDRDGEDAAQCQRVLRWADAIAALLPPEG